MTGLRLENMEDRHVGRSTDGYSFGCQRWRLVISQWVP